MGLDIRHIKATTQQNTTDSYFEKYWIKEKEPGLELFEKYLQSVQSSEPVHTLHIVPDQKTLEVYEKSKSNKYWCQLEDILIGKLNWRMRRKIKKYEQTKELSGLKSIITRSTDNIATKREGFEITHYSKIYYEPVMISVFYYEEAGYQRKAMTDHFYNEFENFEPYYDLESVKKAKRYINESLNDYPSLAENFQENFIDNFEYGKSIFYASW